MRDFLRSRSTVQLPSTVDNFRQLLVLHNTLFIAFSMNERKKLMKKSGKEIRIFV